MKVELQKCPKCGSNNLESDGSGEYWYGVYEHYEWICADCGYCEEQYYYDKQKERQIYMKERRERNE